MIFLEIYACYLLIVLTRKCWDDSKVQRKWNKAFPKFGEYDRD